ncbi:MAG TPA: dihydropteroate synthase [Actinomycetota bacterium]|jgi:dihydropteroate synthase|nr:dihydropteroate synthase [Actinomycetota bacterium]
MRVELARHSLVTDTCLVMGIVNRTPDSFYDGGRMVLQDAIDYSLGLIEEGADILDVGAVRAGPGVEVPPAEELRRLVPLVEALAGATTVPISVETARPEVARAAIEAGAAMINDVSALADRGLAEVCAETGAGLVLMHNGGQIRGRPRHPRYDDVVAAVIACWRELEGAALQAGVGRQQLMVDPGLDFGKNTFQSLELVRRLPELVRLGLPVLIAASRKDIVGETLALALDQRLEGSLAVVALSVLHGAAMVRVHDVRASVRTVRMVSAVLGKTPPRAPVRGLWE